VKISVSPSRSATCTSAALRGADSGPRRRIASLPAFWVGLVYDEISLDAAWDLVKEWTAEEREKLRDDVPKLALRAQIRGRSVRDLASVCLNLAHQGLARRARWPLPIVSSSGFPPVAAMT